MGVVTSHFGQPFRAARPASGWQFFRFVVELVYTSDLSSDAVRIESSSLSGPTFFGGNMVAGVWYDCGKKIYLQRLAKENLQSTLKSYVRAKNEYVALEQHIATARKAAKTFTEEKKFDDAKKIGRKIRSLKNTRRDTYYNCRYLKWQVKMAREFYMDILRLDNQSN